MQIRSVPNTVVSSGAPSRSPGQTASQNPVVSSVDVSSSDAESPPSQTAYAIVPLRAMSASHLDPGLTVQQRRALKTYLGVQGMSPNSTDVVGLNLRA